MTNKVKPIKAKSSDQKLVTGYECPKCKKIVGLKVFQQYNDKFEWQRKDEGCTTCWHKFDWSDTE